MAKLALALLLISMAMAMPWAQPQDLKWAKRLDSGGQPTTNLQFYFHDTLSGKTPTAVRVAQASQTDKSPTLFGALLMADDPLTEGPDLSSKLVGRAQGLYGSASQEGFGLIMALSYGFCDGIYNGSSISVLGLNQALNPVRELPVVGGTGVFRMARGFAEARTHWFDPATGDAIVAYNVTVFHN